MMDVITEQLVDEMATVCERAKQWRALRDRLLPVFERVVQQGYEVSFVEEGDGLEVMLRGKEQLPPTWLVKEVYAGLERAGWNTRDLWPQVDTCTMWSNEDNEVRLWLFLDQGSVNAIQQEYAHASLPQGLPDPADVPQELRQSSSPDEQDDDYIPF